MVDLEIVENAWARCAAKVDAYIKCRMEQTDEKATPAARIPP